jgi:hypothetical protein
MSGHDTQRILFAGLPRRRRLGAPVVIGLWLVLAIAFLTDVVPTQPSAEWLYDLEARRADYARTFAAERAARAADDALAASRRASAAPERAGGDFASLAPAALAAEVGGTRQHAATPCTVR